MFKKLFYLNCWILLFFYSLAVFFIPNFLSLPMFLYTIQTISLMIFLAMGTSFVLLNKSIDLSVGVVIGITSYILALFNHLSLPIWSAIGVAFIFASLVAVANYLLIYKFHINAIFATLVVAFLTRGLVSFLCFNSVSVYIIDHSFYNAHATSVWMIFSVFVLIFYLLTPILPHRFPMIYSRILLLAQSPRLVRRLNFSSSLFQFLSYLFSSISAMICGIMITFMSGLGHPDIGNDLGVQYLFLVVLVGLYMWQYRFHSVMFIVSCLILFLAQQLFWELFSEQTSGKITEVTISAFLAVIVYFLRRILLKLILLKKSYY